MHKMDETVFIIDDDISIQRSLSLFLSAYDYTVETFSSSEEYLEREIFTGTGCIILDINMEGKSGLELQDELLTLGSHLPVIFITSKGNVHLSVQTIRKGAVNFLEKPFKEDELLNSVSEAIELSRTLKTEKDEIRIAKDLTKLLTTRETEILRYLITGMLNKQTAAALSISEHTVQLHKLSISNKLGVKSIPEMIRIANLAGIDPYQGKSEVQG
jgi:FixJ family two-component response regulator